MDIILCHTTADFDTLGAAVGVTRLSPGSRIVLAGGCHPGVRQFLALHRDEYPLIERRSVNPDRIRSVTVVDTQQRDRLGKTAEWLDLPVPISVWDHHPHVHSDIPATETHIEALGATTTAIVEQLRLGLDPHPNGPILNVAEATVMALGIHVDTGSLTFDHTTPRDAIALAWLMEQGASLSVIAEYIEPGLSPRLQDLLTTALDTLHTETIQGHPVSTVLLETPEYIAGLSSVAAQIMEITDTEALLLGNRYPIKGSDEHRLMVIGRSRIARTNLQTLFTPWGGGGHPRASSVSLRLTDPVATFQEILEDFKTQIPHQPVARELMSSPVRTIRPETTIHEAQRILLRYGHSGLSVVNEAGTLVGVICRRDLDIALHHGLGHAPVKGYMSSNVRTIAPDTPLPEIEDLMVTFDIGRLPVLSEGALQGIVTRTDVLRQLHQDSAIGSKSNLTTGSPPYCPLPREVASLLANRLAPQLGTLLNRAAQLAEERGWHLYLVGGAVRDILWAIYHQEGSAGFKLLEKEESRKEPEGDRAPLLLTDIDLVVDGFDSRADDAAGVELAEQLQKLYPTARLDIHGQFQTAALLWHKDPELDSLWVDIATARTEFYPYPAANPEVEASSIRQDLYRRDFTLNALAVRLTGPNRRGEILDFFGGWLDLQAGQIRVLHANSFIEDPTRIYRAVRFAVRLGFEIEPQTQGYIRLAMESGVYLRSPELTRRVPALETRLKNELKYILQAPYWQRALQLLDSFDALRCIHPSLKLDRDLWQQLRSVDRWIRQIQGTVNGAESPLKTLPESWQIRLELLIAHLEPQWRGEVAQNLQMSTDSIERLEQLATAAIAVTPVQEISRPSEVVRLLSRYDRTLLMAIAVMSPKVVRRRIWQYIHHWMNAKPLLNGNDLKALGYKPGPHFKTILDSLLAATLDGQIQSRSDAEAYLGQYFPRDSIQRP
ncbi:CBS domain-containing protein [Laspinema sp. A4]|uniref:CBS domain-containing protein n=1 Tax=Laspinema sp. D2d TaxID=2953686 RepID=UPI0021BB1940|nr:CBS domain-containing protein [Laspinema sp. D2d]MCT7984148.1 CBS domain-containing protein [Laspinema sp. D2d]